MKVRPLYFTVSLIAVLLMVSVNSTAENTNLNQVKNLLSTLNNINPATSNDYKGLIAKLRPFSKQVPFLTNLEKFRYYSLLANAYGHLDDNRAFYYHQLIEKITDPSIVLEPGYPVHLHNYAFRNIETNNLKHAKQLATQLQQLANAQKTLKAQVLSLTLNTTIASIENRWVNAMQSILTAYALAFNDEHSATDNSKLFKIKANVVFELALMYQSFNQQKAYEMHQQSLAMDTSIGDLAGIEANYHFLAMLSIELGHLAETQSYINALLEYSRKQQRPLGFISAYTSQSRYHLALGDISNALEAILRAQVHINKDTLVTLKERYVLQHCQVMVAMNKNKESLTLLQKNKAIFNGEQPDIKRQIRYFELLAQTYAGLQQYELAYETQVQYQHLYNKLIHEKSIKELELMRIQLESNDTKKRKKADNG